MRILALLVTLFASVWPAPQATTRSFAIVAHRFSYDITPSPFVVNQGDTVTLDITSSDVEHGFALDGYPTVNFNNILPGKHTTVTFVANTPGTFTYQCTFFCGSGHSNMNGVFTVTAAAAAPTIASFAPSSGPAAGGTVVAITGTNFQNGATVQFGSAAAVSVTVNTATSISAIAPVHAAGAVTITVTNPDGQSATSAGSYTYVAPAGHGKRRAVRQHG